MAMKSTIWFTIIAGAMISVATGLGAWNLNKTASIPEKYATKLEAAEIKAGAEKDRDRIRDEIKSGFEDIKTEQRAVRQSLEDLNKYLRRHGE